MHEKPPTILEHFGKLSDPRVRLKTQHKLIDIVIITICGVICGADNWTEIASYGEIKRKWFESFLELPNGIPSHDTFGTSFFIAVAGRIPKMFFELDTIGIYRY